MKLHLVLPFIGFLLKKMFSGVIKVHHEYQNEMDHNPALMLFAGTVCGFLFIVATTLLSIGIYQLGFVEFMSERLFVKSAFIGSIIFAVGYITYSFFNAQFNKFLEERRALFDVIKDASNPDYR